MFIYFLILDQSIKEILIIFSDLENSHYAREIASYLHSESMFLWRKINIKLNTIYILKNKTLYI